MCRRVTCSQCSKPSWAGCGMHVDSVRGKVAGQGAACHAPSLAACAALQRRSLRWRQRLHHQLSGAGGRRACGGTG
ncbi:MAG: hypothetical protein J3K34DRAFT_421782 [Monoraphidium minutum]|nr:MAG: hypothetical protein J3K34DRAFT_421782 [Monoraphidium minutum]